MAFEPEWRTSLDELLAVTRLMQAFPHRWFVSGGWALDLFLGEVTRDHEDIEVEVERCNQRAIRDLLPDWSLFKALRGPEGGYWDPWPAEEWLERPVHQVLARREGATPPEFEFFLSDTDGEIWFLRDEPRIRRPIDDTILRFGDGIPLVAPEVQLLHKAWKPRPKDEHDFERVLPQLDDSQRAWLRTALELGYSGHPWIAPLAQAAPQARAHRSG